MTGIFASRWPPERALARTAAALILPLLAFAGWLRLARGSMDLLLVTIAPRAWAAALVLVLAAAAVAAVRVRARLRALAWGLALASVLALLVGVGSRYSGVLELGEGEPGGDWASLTAGPFATPPALEVVELPQQPAGKARLRIAGREVEGRPGEILHAGADRIEVARVAPAAAFEIGRERGELLEGLIVKLHPGGGNDFGFERLPHRAMVPLPASGDRVVPTPAALRLRVQRGKLAVADRTVKRGEVLHFEALALSYVADERWARVEVHGGRPGGYWLAGVLGLLACTGAWIDRRRRRA